LISDLILIRFDLDLELIWSYLEI